MNTIRVIAQLTFREAIRRRIVLAALVLGLAFLTLYGLGFHYIDVDLRLSTGSARSTNPLIRQQAYNFLVLAGMYVVNFLTIAIAALITADTLAGEIQSGTIQSLVSKPVRRGALVLGKWLGQAFLLLLYLSLVGGGVLLIVWLLAGYQTPNWPAAMALIYFNGLIIMTLTLAFSSSLSTLATGGAVFGAFGVAFIGGWMERIGSVLQNQTAVDLGIASSLLLPSEALWNKASSLMSTPALGMAGMTPFTSASEPSNIMLFYAVVYVLAMLGLAVWLFSRRDL
jgi:Cu-processing system permease protein